jgi:hypothetical protein
MPALLMAAIDFLYVPFRMADDMKVIFGLSMCVMLKASELLIGAIIFFITHGEQNHIKLDHNLLIFCGYKVIFFMMHFIPCNIGSELLDVTDGFAYDLFSSEWVDGDLRFRKSMVIFGECLKQPIGMSFWGYEKMNREMFKEVRSGLGVGL